MQLPYFVNLIYIFGPFSASTQLRERVINTVVPLLFLAANVLLCPSVGV